MTAQADEPMDGGLRIDPIIARVLLRYRETVAAATEQVIVELAEMGVDPADALAASELLRSPTA